MTTLTARLHRESRTWLSNPETIIIVAMMTGHDLLRERSGADTALSPVPGALRADASHGDRHLRGLRAKPSSGAPHDRCTVGSHWPPPHCSGRADAQHHRDGDRVFRSNRGPSIGTCFQGT